MAEENSSQEKTEEASPRKLNKAREDGQLPRSRELNTVAVVVVGALVLLSIGPMLSDRLLAFSEAAFSRAASGVEMTTFLSEALAVLLWLVVPFALFQMVSGVVSSLAVGGYVFSTKALAFKGDRLSPIKGVKRIFSRKSFVELAKAIGKFLLISGVAIFALLGVADQLLVLSDKSFETAIAEGLTVVMLCVLAMGVILAFVALVDVPFQLSDHKRQMRMTKQEVKDEHKDSEGKPEVRAKIRQMQQSIANNRMLSDVADADVVITNPEHYSVALKYNADHSAAPLVIAKGADHMAFRIREIATANGIAIVEVPPLTRAVYYAVDVGNQIPGALYVAVAQVLAYVYQLDAWRRGATQGPRPELPGELPIPDELRRDDP